MKSWEEKTFELVKWIRNRVVAAGARGLVVGLSGGIDSAVVAELCRLAYPEKTLAVALPCNSNPADLRDAELVANQLGLPFKKIYLGEAFAAFKEILGIIKEEEKTLPVANIKPRLRMTVLYYFASSHNYLVAGTGNKSELTIGYFTKYGDGGVDLLPLGEMVKTEVRELAYYLGIPEEIILRPPSAGLWEGQTDEDELGFSYAQLDKYILSGEGPPEVKEKVEKLKAQSQHKRKMPPIADILK